VKQLSDKLDGFRAKEFKQLYYKHEANGLKFPLLVLMYTFFPKGYAIPQ
jgi:hypothetical protein